MSQGSFYEIYEERIDKNSKDLKEAFGNLNFQPAYSVKTNFTPMIIDRFYRNGFLIECVSDMEVEIALTIGVPLSKIIYNGPRKGIIASTVANCGGILCFDNLEDFLASQPYMPGTRCMFRVAVNVDNGVDTRFGSRPDEIERLMFEAKCMGYNTVGIHCHVTKGRDLKSWERRIDVMSRVYGQVKHLLTEKIVDFGGNMYSPMPEEKAATYDDYAGYQDYAALFECSMHKLDEAKIILETGTSVVANCMDFVADVLDVKKTDDNTYVLLDCSKYHLGWATDRYNFPIEVIKNPDTLQRVNVDNAFFVGRLCTEGDVIYTGFSGEIGAGDQIRFKNVGAYTIGVKPPFIVPHSKALYIDRHGHYRLAKRGETYEDAMATYFWR